MKDFILKIFNRKAWVYKHLNEASKKYRDLGDKLRYAEKRHWPRKQLRLDFEIARIRFEKWYKLWLKERAA